jgi:hypothetical protein
MYVINDESEEGRVHPMDIICLLPPSMPLTLPCNAIEEFAMPIVDAYAASKKNKMTRPRAAIREKLFYYGYNPKITSTLLARNATGRRTGIRP